MLWTGLPPGELPMGEFRYCREETPEFRSRMENWLQQIAQLLKERLEGNYVATILIGGYGMGWGAMQHTPQGPLPVNDLDVVVVTRDRISSETALALHREATALVYPESAYDMQDASRMDVHVDIMNFTEGDLRRLEPAQFNLDLVQASRLVDGKDVLADAVRVQPGDLDAGDALRLVYNHALNLFEPLISGGCDDPATRTALFFTSTKAAVRAGAAVALLAGRYVPDPGERLAVLEELLAQDEWSRRFERPEAFLQTVREATYARAQATEERVLDMPRYFGEAQSAILDASTVVTGGAFGRDVTTRAEAAAVIAEHWARENVHSRAAGMAFRPRQAARSLLQAVGLRSRPPDHRKKAAVYAAGLMLLKAVSLRECPEVNVDPAALGVARQYLEQAGLSAGSGTSFEDWRSSAKTAVSAWKRHNWIR